MKIKRNITIVGFGNSIIEAVTRTPEPKNRWLNILHDQLSAKFREYSFKVVNSGVGGNSAREAMLRFETDVLSHDPDWVLLEFGGNNDNPGKPERMVSLEEFGRHLDMFKSRRSANTDVIVITIPPIIDDQHSFASYDYHHQFGGINASLERYRAITRIFAVDNGFLLVDLYGKLKQQTPENDPNRYTLPDGVHLTEAGNQVLAEMGFEVLEDLISLNTI